jgi:acetyl-CoA carboxylase carboxyl transferase subunit alpha
MKLTAQDLQRLGVIDEIVPEPLGGAHRQPTEALDALGDRIEAALRKLTPLDGGSLRAKRQEKFLEMGRQGLG